MDFLGSAAIGVVLGWTTRLVGRHDGWPISFGWRAWSFAAAALIGAMALAHLHEGLPGAGVSLLGFAAGAGAALLAPRLFPGSG